MSCTHEPVEVTPSVYPAWLWLPLELCYGETANDQTILSYGGIAWAILLVDTDHMYKLALLILCSDVPLI